MPGDMFLKLENIDGESKDDKHKDEIEILSWSWGMSQEGSFARGGGGGSGKVAVQDVAFTKYMDKSTPTLMKYCCDGAHITKGVLVCRKASGDQQLEYLKITMNDIIVSSYQTGGSDGGDIPIDNFSLNFARYETEYVEQNDDGTRGASVSQGWDIKKNKAA